MLDFDDSYIHLEPHWRLQWASIDIKSLIFVTVTHFRDLEHSFGTAKEISIYFNGRQKLDFDDSYTLSGPLWKSLNIGSLILMTVTHFRDTIRESLILTTVIHFLDLIGDFSGLPWTPNA